LDLRLITTAQPSPSNACQAIHGWPAESMAAAELLEARGERRGRYYVASDLLTSLEASIYRDRAPIPDPFEA